MTKMGCALLIIKKGDLDEAEKLMDDLLPAVDNRVMKSYVKLYKAEVLFHKGNKEAGLELYRSVISSFTTFGLPMFLTIAHNSRGVSYFILEDYVEAEKDWLKARRYAREAKSEYAEGKILPNLADIAMKKGKFDLARSLLDRSADIFLKFNDFEGISVIEFNLALLSIETGDIAGIKEHFQRCREVAFPLPPPHMLEIFKEELIKRGREKKIEDIEKLI